MAVTAPNQRWDALDRANDVRSRRRELKQQLAVRLVSLEDVVREPEWWLLRVPTHELLSWAPRSGTASVSKVLRHAGVWPLRPVGDLTVRQREAIVTALRGEPVIPVLKPRRPAPAPLVDACSSCGVELAVPTRVGFCVEESEQFKGEER